VVALQTNQKLDVVNDDPTTTNIHPMPNNNREWKIAGPMACRSKNRFREEIAIPVKCNVHRGCEATRGVQTSYFVVTDKTVTST